MMLKIISIGILLLLSAAHISVVYAESGKVIDPAKAKMAESVIRQWPGLSQNATLILRESRQSKPIGGYTRYIFDAPGYNQTFGVDIESGEVDFWYNNDYKSGSNSLTGQNIIAESVVAEKALAFAKAHCREFEQSELKQGIAGLFQRQLKNGIWDMGLSVAVGIDRYSGEIYSYKVFRQKPLYISTDPKISKAQAETIAVRLYAGMPAFDAWSAAKTAFVAANDNLLVEYDDIGLQRLVWGIMVVTSPDTKLTPVRYARDKDLDEVRLISTEHAVLVDALTGEIASANGYNMEYVLKGIKIKKVKGILHRTGSPVACYPRLRVVLAGSEDYPLEVSVPPLLIDGTPYLYARFVAAMLGLHVVSETSHRVVIDGGDPMKPNVGSPVVLANKGQHSGKVIFDRLYVPLDTVNRLYRCNIKWRARGKLLVFPIKK